MTTGFGAPPTIGQDLDGNRTVTVGTMDSDIRKILGGLYTPGLIKGGEIKRSSTAFTYQVAAGVGIVKDVEGQHIAIPWDAATLTVPKPTTNRSEWVYVVQGYPSDNNGSGDSGVYVRVTNGKLPPRALLLGSYVLPANSTGTASAAEADAIDYSIPYGGSLGVLHRSVDTRSGDFPEAIGATAYSNQGTFTVPTDRFVRIEISAAISAAGGGVVTTPIEPQFWPQIDNTDVTMWVQEVSQSWSTYYFSYLASVKAGTHTVRLKRVTHSPSGRKARANYTGPGGHGGIVVTYSDAGVML